MTTSVVHYGGRRAGKTFRMKGWARGDIAARTARQINAEACGRDCRQPGYCTDWPTCACPILPVGWFPAGRRPDARGAYERLTMLGPKVDLWDGERWRRPVTKNGAGAVDRSTDRRRGLFIAPYNGVVCANQHLPWRLVERQPAGTDLDFRLGTAILCEVLTRKAA